MCSRYSVKMQHKNATRQHFPGSGCIFVAYLLKRNTKTQHVAFLLHICCIFVAFLLLFCYACGFTSVFPSLSVWENFFLALVVVPELLDSWFSETFSFLKKFTSSKVLLLYFEPPLPHMPSLNRHSSITPTGAIQARTASRSATVAREYPSVLIGEGEPYWSQSFKV